MWRHPRFGECFLYFRLLNYWIMKTQEGQMYGLGGVTPDMDRGSAWVRCMCRPNTSALYQRGTLRHAVLFSSQSNSSDTVCSFIAIEGMHIIS